MQKSDAKKLVAQMRDYIPGGKPIVDIAALTFRRTQEHEVLLCGTRTGHDIQSGPCYCGAVADWVAVTADGTAAVCDRHANKIGIRRHEDKP
jgi:hypothetical protein